MKMPSVVISGGSRGIGKAVATQFAQKGYPVIVSARKKENLLKLKTFIEDKYQVSCHTFSTDLSKRENVVQFVAFISTLKVEIRVLINNAGIFIPGNISDEEGGQLERMIETNLYSAYNLTRGLLPSLRTVASQKHPSHIFNVCSVAGQKSYKNGGSYSISKFAMRGFSDNLREELREENIRVTNVIPGAVLTDSWAGFDGPKDRLMAPEDIAQSIWDAYSLSPRTMVEEIVLRPQLGDL